MTRAQHEAERAGWRGPTGVGVAWDEALLWSEAGKKKHGACADARAPGGRSEHHSHLTQHSICI